MPKKEVPLDHLRNYLPPGTLDPVTAYLSDHNVHLTIARERSSILGDYRHRTDHTHHRISVNGNLNQYSFLVTLLHELAHLLTFERYGRRVQPHGTEWKTIFGKLLQQFLSGTNGAAQVFPEDIEKELRRSLQNPAASSCAEEGLLKALRKYDQKSPGQQLLEELPPRTRFKIKDGREFEKGDQLRKRFKCKELSTGKFYLFSPVYEVRVADR